MLTRPRAFDGLVLKDAPFKRPVRVLTEKQVIAYTTIGRSNLNRLVRAAKFPAPLKLSSHKIGWLKHEIDAWIRNRPRPAVIVTGRDFDRGDGGSGAASVPVTPA